MEVATPEELGFAVEGPSLDAESGGQNGDPEPSALGGASVPATVLEQHPEVAK